MKMVIKVGETLGTLNFQLSSHTKIYRKTHSRDQIDITIVIPDIEKNVSNDYEKWSRHEIL